MNSRRSQRIVVELVLAVAALATLVLPGVFSLPTRLVQARPAASTGVQQKLDEARRSSIERLYAKLKVAAHHRAGDVDPGVGIQTACTSTQYSVNTTSTTAGIIPGADDVGNHGDDLATTITLPFPYRLYDQTFTTAVVSSNGVLQFIGNNADPANTCLPNAAFNYAIFAHWDDLCTSGDCSTGGPPVGDTTIEYGIFTSTFGEAGDRTFVIEWRTIYKDSVGSIPEQIANFELRLYEGQKKFDIIYGTLAEEGCSATVGVQKDMGSCSTEYLCNPGCMTPTVTSGPSASLAAGPTASLTSGLELTFEAPIDCSLSCTPDINTPTDAGKCGAAVNYALPTPAGNCGTVTCKDINGVVSNPGDFFPVGTTTIFCTAGDGFCSFNITVTDNVPPAITCPADVTKPTDSNRCSATVNYPAPIVTDDCPAQVSCQPPSGSTFPKGATTVTCMATDQESNQASCMFTVTVNDTTKPTITCPPNTTIIVGSEPCGVATFPSPAISDNCPDATVACVPPSGYCFPLGTNTVICTARDTSNNTAECSFVVTVGNVCLQDETNRSTVFIGNASTGAYRFCCGGTVVTGIARVTRRGNLIAFDDQRPDRRMQAGIDVGAFTGSAVLQFGAIRCTIQDRDTRNNSCMCQ